MQHQIPIFLFFLNIDKQFFWQTHIKQLAPTFSDHKYLHEYSYLYYLFFYIDYVQLMMTYYNLILIVMLNHHHLHHHHLHCYYHHFHYYSVDYLFHQKSYYNLHHHMQFLIVLFDQNRHLYNIDLMHSY